MRSDVIFQSSPWWILVCLLVGAVYAFAMYQPLPRLVGSGATVGGFDKRTTYALAALRFVVVSFLCLSAAQSAYPQPAHPDRKTQGCAGH